MIKELLTDLKNITGIEVEYQKVVNKKNKLNNTEFMVVKTNKSTVYRNITGAESITVLSDFLKIVKGTETFIDDMIFYKNLLKFGRIVK